MKQNRNEFVSSNNQNQFVAVFTLKSILKNFSISPDFSSNSKAMMKQHLREIKLHKIYIYCIFKSLQFYNRFRK